VFGDGGSWSNRVRVTSSPAVGRQRSGGRGMSKGARRKGRVGIWRGGGGEGGGGFSAGAVDADDEGKEFEGRSG